MSLFCAIGVGVTVFFSAVGVNVVIYLAYSRLKQMTGKEPEKTDAYASGVVTGKGAGR